MTKIDDNDNKKIVGKCESEGKLISPKEMQMPVIIETNKTVEDIRMKSNPISEIISKIYFQQFDWPKTIS